MAPVFCGSLGHAVPNSSVVALVCRGFLDDVPSRPVVTLVRHGLLRQDVPSSPVVAQVSHGSLQDVPSPLVVAQVSHGSLHPFVVLGFCDLPQHHNVPGRDLVAHFVRGSLSYLGRVASNPPIQGSSRVADAVRFSHGVTQGGVPDEDMETGVAWLLGGGRTGA